MSLSYWNNTSSNKSDPYFFDYYTAPSENAAEFLQMSTYLQRPIVDQENTFETIEIDEVGQVARGDFVLKQSSGAMVPPFSMNKLAPTGNYTYIAHAIFREHLADAFTSVYLNSSEPVQDCEAFTPVLVACDTRLTTPTEMVYRDGMQLPTIKNREFLAPRHRHLVQGRLHQHSKIQHDQWSKDKTVISWT
ncbi:hypothetical protein CDEST_14855 [Colletotrichum destructivum]|uniref:Uncharacterized protein n=1 Tax=Colletotrichum destructivum TaxID=34406 RepID=A0AAX4J379_9PEZI|nr:hypothetical protein CDEST_14855 [Colletotrichum destructivum]